MTKTLAEKITDADLHAEHLIKRSPSGYHDTPEAFFARAAMEAKDNGDDIFSEHCESRRVDWILRCTGLLYTAWRRDDAAGRLEAIHRAIKCGICPVSKMRDNPCRHCTKNYATMLDVNALFKEVEILRRGGQYHIAEINRLRGLLEARAESEEHGSES